jgi:hypothetical protein
MSFSHNFLLKVNCDFNPILLFVVHAANTGFGFVGVLESQDRS